MVEIRQATAEDIPGVQALLREYFNWVFSLEEDSESAPTFQGVEEEIRTLPGIYAPPKGRLLVARVDGEMAGCVALKPHTDVKSELKRLYVSPKFRGHQLGVKLTQALIDEARSIGYRCIVLDSHISLESAHHVYRSLGFVNVDAPLDFPEEFKPVVVFMRLDL